MITIAIADDHPIVLDVRMIQEKGNPMRIKRFMFAVYAAFVALPIAAQNTSDSEKLLLPISAGIVRGAHGSEWATTAAVTNLSGMPLSVSGYVGGPCANIACGPTPSVPSQATIFVYNQIRSSEVHGNFLWIERGRRKDIAVTLRTRDLSRQRETWGTSLPVVSEEDLFSRPFGLVDVPMEAQFRSTLRIYDFNADTAAAVRVRVYAVDSSRDYPTDSRSDTLLLEFTPQFVVPSTGGGSLLHPGYIEFPLWLQPLLVSVNRVRIEIEPLNDTQDYWAFVSVTHNETQHVTIIAPQ